MTERTPSNPILLAEGVSRPSRTGMGLWAAIATWTVAVGIGMGYIWRYEHQPGQAGQAPVTWPEQSELVASSDRFTLLFFAHPKCPCTRASLDELSRLMTDCRGQVDGHAVFVKPDDAADGESWDSTDLWRTAEQIPGVTVRLDQGGWEAKRFAAQTSGQVVLYDAQHVLRFQGGITASRGHSGDNAGRASIVALIQRGASEIDRTEVYGCELDNQERPACCQR